MHPLRFEEFACRLRCRRNEADYDNLLTHVDEVIGLKAGDSFRGEKVTKILLHVYRRTAYDAVRATCRPNYSPFDARWNERDERASIAPSKCLVSVSDDPHRDSHIGLPKGDC